MTRLLDASARIDVVTQDIKELAATNAELRIMFDVKLKDTKAELLALMDAVELKRRSLAKMAAKGGG